MTGSDENPTSQLDSFREDILAGLARSQKTIPSRWLYDDRGCELFERITCVEDYYPTRTETAILRDHTEAIREFCGTHSTVVEYGAGAGIKTEILLATLNCPVAYVPIDIAGDFLGVTVARLKTTFPQLPMRPVVADFTRDFDLPTQHAGSGGARVAFFPGSTIGNLEPDEATAFLRRARSLLGEGGALVLGVDLKKDHGRLHDAYN
ncbi:MAG: L-histidine N(alpha)-methyltransferase, partial [Variovorax sp.]